MSTHTNTMFYQTATLYMYKVTHYKVAYTHTNRHM